METVEATIPVLVTDGALKEWIEVNVEVEFYQYEEIEGDYPYCYRRFMATEIEKVKLIDDEDIEIFGGRDLAEEHWDTKEAKEVIEAEIDHYLN